MKERYPDTTNNHLVAAEEHLRSLLAEAASENLELLQQVYQLRAENEALRQLLADQQESHND